MNLKRIQTLARTHYRSGALPVFLEPFDHFGDDGEISYKHRRQRAAHVAIKAVSKERIDEALLEFDRDFRGRREWHGWETNPAHRYAIAVGGTSYPVKKIVSLATEIAVSQFPGGHLTNRYLEKRGFTIIELQSTGLEPVLQFEHGAIYDRVTEINGPFGGSRQSGIRYLPGDFFVYWR